MSLRSAVVWVALPFVLDGCGTIDPGSDFQFATVTYDQNFFYCKVEPMLVAEQCGPGQSGTDPPNGCHYNVTTFHLQQHDPIACKGIVPSGGVPSAAQSNYQAAEREMSPDPERAPLLERPTEQAAHPRQIFPPMSMEADLIRQWANQYSSQ